MKILNHGIDHVEFILRDIAPLAKTFQRMGFEKIGERSLAHRGIRSELFAQGYVRVMLTQALGQHGTSVEHSLEFLNLQDEGICVLAVEVPDARQTFAETVSRGARPAMEPRVYDSSQGSVVRAEIWTPGRVRYAFIERKGGQGAEGACLFDEGLVASRMKSPAPLGFKRIDHLTNNVDMGQMKVWVDWYKKVFDFTVTRHFDISTGRTGLVSDVVQSSDGKVIVPVNEATEKESQVQEFVDRLKGAGVQHLALETENLISTLGHLRKEGFKFLEVPHTYYEAIPKRVKGVTEDLGVLEDLGILVDGETNDGYLLQIFTGELLGPFFFEFIQRKGDKGFGEGNFRALFEAIERDQIQRGVLK